MRIVDIAYEDGIPELETDMCGRWNTVNVKYQKELSYIINHQIMINVFIF